ncbi:MAG: plasmid stabilization protein [Ancylobacter novellus]|uniref:Plasmid stabilization protein n=1 Tax=Ancylobacter novellus TaxID=921 RepID=A0A2W5M9W8_ANCNO|nr:MAG: plasmid stabilization protein [Ancylobacter novellus]
MASVTIRKLDDDVKAKLKQRAARNGRSLETELREALVALADAEPKDHRNMAERIRDRIEPLGGVDLQGFPKTPIPAPIVFDE